MSCQGPPPTTTAKPPFDDVHADVVLRTSDHVDFRVYRVILALASSFFRDGTFASQFLINVPENAHTLDALLRIVSPNTDVPFFEDVQDAIQVATAASKYGMSAALARIAACVKAELVASDPLLVYFLACRMGWEDVAGAAAKHCLDPDLTAFMYEDLVDSELLDYQGSGVAYHNLERFRCDYRQSVENKLDGMGLYKGKWASDTSCISVKDPEVDWEAVSGHCLKLWMKQYLERMRVTALACPDMDVPYHDLTGFCPPSSWDCSRRDLSIVETIATARHEIALQVSSALEETKLRFGS